MELRKEEIINIFGPSPYIDPDLIYDIIPGLSAKGKIALSPENEFFSGHFPDRPVMPGVLILDMMSKVAISIFVADNKFRPDFSSPGYLAGGEDVKFRKTLVPGDLLLLSAKKISEQDNTRKVECRGMTNGEEAVSCILEIRLTG